VLRVQQHLPDLADGLSQVSKIALIGCDHLFPVPLVDVAAVVMVEEVVLADCSHVCADAFAWPAVELLERCSLPLGRCLHYLSINRVLVAVITDVKADRRA
jgi:hypothetical protein